MSDAAAPDRIPIVPDPTADLGSRTIVVDADICRAARGLANWTTPKLAREAGISVADVNLVESNRNPVRPDARARILAALERVGIVFVSASEGGPGVLRPVR